MFNKKKPVPRVTIDQFSSLISGNLSLIGDVTFEEGLKVSGEVRGDVCHKPGWSEGPNMEERE